MNKGQAHVLLHEHLIDSAVRLLICDKMSTKNKKFVSCNPGILLDYKILISSCCFTPRQNGTTRQTYEMVLAKVFHAIL